MPKPVCRASLNNRWVQYEVCITFLGIQCGYEYHSSGLAVKGEAIDGPELRTHEAAPANQPLPQAQERVRERRRVRDGARARAPAPGRKEEEERDPGRGNSDRRGHRPTNPASQPVDQKGFPYIVRDFLL